MSYEIALRHKSEGGGLENMRTQIEEIENNIKNYEANCSILKCRNPLDIFEKQKSIVEIWNFLHIIFSFSRKETLKGFFEKDNLPDIIKSIIADNTIKINNEILNQKSTYIFRDINLILKMLTESMGISYIANAGELKHDISDLDLWCKLAENVNYTEENYNSLKSLFGDNLKGFIEGIDACI